MERYKKTKIAGIFGIIGNLFLLIIKLAVGFISNSQAMIADAINSASDIFASFMTAIGNKIASIPKDNDHNFGHGKAEYIFSMLISLSMMGISIKMFYDSLMSIINNNKLEFSWWLIIVCIVTIITKLFLWLYTKNTYIKYPSLLLKSNMIDHRNDCFITLFTTFSIILSKYGINFVDGITGMGISMWIFISGIKIFLESYNVLMDRSVDDKTKDIILDLVHSYKDIKKVKDINSSPVGYKYMVFLTIQVDGEMTTKDSHSLADCLEMDIKRIDKVYKAIVHVEPYTA